MTTRPDLTAARDALLDIIDREPMFDDADRITAMNGTVREPRTMADAVEAYRTRLLARLAALPDGWTLARAEAGVSLEEMGKAWAAVEAALPEHRYFKVEHDSDDDPSWYLAVWRSDGIFPDPIRWAQADTLLDGLTRLALELRTPR